MRRRIITCIMLPLIACLLLASVFLSGAAPVMALSPIASQLIRVWYFDSVNEKWLLYDPSVPNELNTLNTLKKGNEIFILVKSSMYITTGSGVTVNMSPGWNRVIW